MGELAGVRVDAKQVERTAEALGRLHELGYETWAMTPDPDAVNAFDPNVSQWATRPPTVT